MTATKKPTPQIRGLSGYVLERFQRGQWWTTSDVASAASVSLSQAGACLARLVKAGVVEKGDVHTCGLRLWRRVEAPAAAPTIACPLVVGDHVRFDNAKTHPRHRGRVVSLHLGHLGWAAWVEADEPIAGLAPDNRFHSDVERLIKTAPIAWAHRAGLPVKAGPLTPFEQSIGRGA